MTQKKDSIQRMNEFDARFMDLNENGQDAALTILQALRIAQSKLYAKSTARRCGSVSAKQLYEHIPKKNR
mgnify:CR=1 FL=1